uniref:Uncharacterized protein n=1 Tax=Sphaerodactylus townsendi TaxID=933632 RepID=A0ACB8GBF4_9SAUR
MFVDGYVIFKAKSKYSPELLKYRLPLYLASFFFSLLFLLVNLTCAVLVRMENSESKNIVLVRVAINDTLFVLCAISLSICLYKISKMSLANIYLESKLPFVHFYSEVSLSLVPAFNLRYLVDIHYLVVYEGSL